MKNQPKVLSGVNHLGSNLKILGLRKVKGRHLDIHKNLIKLGYLLIVTQFQVLWNLIVRLWNRFSWPNPFRNSSRIWCNRRGPSNSKPCTKAWLAKQLNLTSHRRTTRSSIDFWTWKSRKQANEFTKEVMRWRVDFWMWARSVKTFRASRKVAKNNSGRMHWKLWSKTPNYCFRRCRQCGINEENIILIFCLK